MVKFQLNKQLDKDMASQFLGTVFGGVDFGRSVWEYHPQLQTLTGKDEVAIDEYFDKFYSENQDVLEESSREFQEQWNEVEETFIQETENLFNGYKFPTGKYIGYVSSFNCNPRFLEDKTFQLFYKADPSVGITSHEIMHFVFYSYTSQNFENKVKNLDTNKGLWWDTAEIFNNVILSSDRFTRILKTEGDVGYPDHQRFIPMAKQLHRSSSSVDEFIKKLFELLEK